MTYRERRERRAARRREWAEGRARKAEQASNRAHTISSGIPFGQPILVGHHSEAHHRRDLARIDSAMRATVDSSRMADRHAACAAEIERQLDRSIYSDDTDAAKRMRAKIAALEAQREREKDINRQIRREIKKGEGWLERIAPPLTDGERRAILHSAQFGWRHKPEFPSYHFQNLSGNIARCRKRLPELERREAQLKRAAETLAEEATDAI